MDQVSRIGMDTSKHIFQLHGVSADEVPVLRKKLRRKDMVTFFAKLAPTVIAIEACGASHHWARLLHRDAQKLMGAMIDDVARSFRRARWAASVSRCTITGFRDPRGMRTPQPVLRCSQNNRAKRLVH